mmetsp:Transcript_23486/g.58788  ORF Transcript_23486/g.58788 Transcript_23486/m.58788 type:complete len:224 (+) Transcript_23486:140-811(+)
MTSTQRLKVRLDKETERRGLARLLHFAVLAHHAKHQRTETTTAAKAIRIETLAVAFHHHWTSFRGTHVVKLGLDIIGMAGTDLEIRVDYHCSACPPLPGWSVCGTLSQSVKILDSSVAHLVREGFAKSFVGIDHFRGEDYPSIGTIVAKAGRLQHPRRPEYRHDWQAAVEYLFVELCKELCSDLFSVATKVLLVFVGFHWHSDPEGCTTIQDGLLSNTLADRV